MIPLNSALASGALRSRRIRAWLAWQRRVCGWSTPDRAGQPGAGLRTVGPAPRRSGRPPRRTRPGSSAWPRRKGGRRRAPGSCSRWPSGPGRVAACGSPFTRANAARLDVHTSVCGCDRPRLRWYASRTAVNSSAARSKRRSSNRLTARLRRQATVSGLLAPTRSVSCCSAVSSSCARLDHPADIPQRHREVGLSVERVPRCPDRARWWRCRAPW